MLKKLPVPDVWNLHWVSWFLDWESMLPWMAERAPIVWTLHDLNPLRGIWHYEPLPPERTAERLRYEACAIELKRRALSHIPKDRLTFVGPSRWMVDECRKSPITEGFPVEHTPYGLDTEVFTPQDPSLLRAMFGIPKEALVIGFIADNINDPRKGLKPLLNAIQRLNSEATGIHLVTVGNGEIHCEGVAHTPLGPIFSDRLISFFYSACDLFVCPSLQDNLPNTVLESLSCGTPVVAYNLGGLPDMIGTRSGILADPSGGSSSLRQSLFDCINNSNLSRSSIRHDAESRYSLRNQAMKYLSLYKSPRLTHL
jgi:glycosyltransferase involved in cell wall biosynthesis